LKATLLRLVLFLAASLLARGSVFTEAERPALTDQERAQGYRQHVILAKPRAEHRALVDTAETNEGYRLRRRFEHVGGIRVIELDDRDSADAAIKRLRATGRYEYVERDRIVHARALPNDPSFGQQWALNNTGQSGGTAGADIGAVAAWDTLSNASSVVVAVIDSGARLTHADLAANLWTNPSPNTSGYVNDLHGINATVSQTATNSGNPTDDEGHGTHVSGTIGAVGNNRTGVTGVAWNVQLMELKALAADGTGSDDAIIACIDYAIGHGASVINASYGSSSYSAAEFDAMQRVHDAGIIFVAAAGNDAQDNDAVGDYPSGYPLDNIVAVAASTRTDTLASFSSYGSGIVELAAPGVEILSTYYGSDTDYYVADGTSMATPHVTGSFALLKARFPNDTYRQLINRLLRSVTPLSSLTGKVQSGGRLNIARALTSTDNRPFNDDFSARAVLSGPTVQIRSSNVGATNEPGEPQHAAASGGHSLWWTWTATSTGQVAIDTTGSSYDTTLAVYSGSSFDSLQVVAANDDDAGVATSRVLFDAVAGHTYQIAVDGKNGAAGQTVVHVGAIPANDAFANAELLTGSNLTVRASTRSASREAGEPNPAAVAAGNSIWYKWVAPATAHYCLAAFAVDNDTVAGVYTGSSLSTLTLVGASDNSAAYNSDALVSFNAIAGVTYYFLIDHNAYDGGTGGSFVLTLTDSRWQFPSGGDATSSPAIGPDGTIYFGSQDSYLFAVNSDGTAKWSLSRGVTGDQIDISTPAVGADGNIYVGSLDGYLYAFNASTGARRWRYATNSPLQTSPAIASDGTIYVKDDTALTALTSGSTAATRKWSRTINGATYSSPSIAGDGTIYVGGDAHSFYAFNADGTTKWTFNADDDVYTTPALGADGTIYFATFAGTVYAVNPNGSTKWTWTIADHSSITSSIAIAADGTLYFGAYDHKLHALRSNGTEAWSFTLGDDVRASSPAIGADGTIYLGCYDSQVYAINANGTLRRTYATAGIIRSSPVLANNRLYFTSSDAKLYAFDVGQSAAGSAWPVFHQGTTRNGRAATNAIVLSALTASQSVAPGASLTLSVTASGPSTLGYQWLKNGVAISGATSSTYTIASATAASAGDYSVVVTSSPNSATSSPVTVSIAGAAPIVTLQPANQSADAGEMIALASLAAGATGFEWQQNGVAVAGSSGFTLTLQNLQPADTGIYAEIFRNATGASTSVPAIVGLSSGLKVAGAGEISGSNILHPNGNHFDQVKVTGVAETITADPDKVTRTSYIDLNDDIVQVEFSGHGTLSLVLAGSSGPAEPVNYTQSGIAYMKGHAGIVIVGADETTNVSIFTVGRATAFDPTGHYDITKPASSTNDPATNGSPLFAGHATTQYDGVADLAFVAIASTNGKFGGVRTANATFWATQGYVGVYAPGVHFTGPVNIGDINAKGSAIPVLQINGADGGVRITGGDLNQDNGASLQVSGLTQVLFTDGATSGNVALPAQNNRGRLVDSSGTDVTAAVVVNPAP
jgi:outer membrane protein assembly factor BamB/subtilisin family serine protease